MRYLITGGAGFIGSYLAEALIRDGGEVYIIDDLSTGSIENVDALRGQPRFHYTIDTIANEPVLAELVDRCDTIFHLAAAVGVELIVESPVRTIETNIYGTELVLKHAAKKRKRVLIASTSEVYGKGSRIPFHEDDDMVFGSSTKGRWAYACSKAIDEFLAISYWKEREVPTTVLRLFNTIGPRQTGRYGMVVPRFVRQALLGEPLTVFGDGLQSRCFTYVGDVVSALTSVADLEGAAGEIYNVGSDQEITILDLARKVRTLTGSASEIVHIPYDEAYEAGFEDMRRRVPDISKIQEATGYRPSLTIEQILPRVIAFERSRLPRRIRERVRIPAPVWDEPEPIAAAP